MTNQRPTLSPEMLLFEVAAMCSRHGLPVDTRNPSAARHYAEQLLRALGLTPDTAPPAAIEPATPQPLPVRSVFGGLDATAPLPRIPRAPEPARHHLRPQLGVVRHDGA